METTKAPSSASVLTHLLATVPGLDKTRIEKALAFARETYGERTIEMMPRITMFEHAAMCTEFLAEFCRDEDAIIASILQYTLKVPDVTLADINKEFGRSVRDIVSRIHLLSHLYTTDWRKSVNDMRIMLVSVSDDIRILLIVLAIACTYLDHLQLVRPEFRMRLCRQSLQLFAPVAARLGIYALKYRLERGAFPECYPVDSQHISQQLKMLHEEHGGFLSRSASVVRKSLLDEGIEAEVMTREKQPYSIFQKMRMKSVNSLGKITDLFAIRVVVPTLGDCYQVLGLLHKLGTPISHRFKDYISFPKPNGYKSLHTCVIGLPHAPKDVMVEVQIRTADMHRDAEYGVASHWIYKETGKTKVARGVQQMQLSDVLLKQQSIGSHDDIDGELALVDHIYVLTPKGDIVELPDGGTSLDFAFIVHTELGLKFKSARVNGSIVPISHKLENGDIVEVAVHKEPRPALQWLEELRTSSARSKLKAYFFANNRHEFLLKGREMLNSELRERHLARLDNDLSFLSKFDGKSLSTKEREDLLVKVGMGSVRSSSVLRHLNLPTVPPRVQPQKKRVKVISKKEELVAFEEKSLSMPYRFAKCCSPDSATPRPEKILGVVARNGIVLIHGSACKMCKGVNPQRRLKMYWKK